MDVQKFLPCIVVNIWCGLPEWVVSGESVEKFEDKLDMVCKDQEQKFYKAQLNSTRSQQSDDVLEPQANYGLFQGIFWEYMRILGNTHNSRIAVGEV